MFNPVSTYRVQFHKDFTFDSFESIIPYLHQLGIKTIYASPIFTAVPGSVHGYDVTDAQTINPEIGSLEQLRKITAKLQSLEMSWVQDIVPNHMALHHTNKWLMDVLEHGKDSKYANYFDIDWAHPAFNNKMVMPILGTSLNEAIDKGDVSIVEINGKLKVKCYDAILPLSGEFSDRKVDGDTLLQIMDAQHYKLEHWQTTNKQINYRRFFTVNGLISLNIQNEEAFNDYHKLMKVLCDDNIFQGVRVDHIDGLYDSLQYLNRLRKLIGDDKYIVVEKILEQGEALPVEWPIQGTTGYDFLGIVNNLFTNAANKKAFTKFYAEEVDDTTRMKNLLHQKKQLILSNYMCGELDNLYRLFVNFELVDANVVSNVGANVIKDAIGEFLILCPVYKFYADRLPLGKEEATEIKNILDEIKKDERLVLAVKLLSDIFLGHNDEDYNKRAIHFYKRCMQFTGPLMAKGVEDTLMYSYNRFIGHNEVGDAPSSFGLSADAFHGLMQDREAIWPAAMNGTSTHDTKRGEDARARLNVITDMTDEWFSAVKEWDEINASFIGEGKVDVNDAYFIYQSLLATYTMPGTDSDNYTERFQAYIQKAFREAKVHSDWGNPNEQYEQLIEQFIDSLLHDDSVFLQSFTNLLDKVVDAGIINSLAQLILKFTCPGIPDTYQGTELWDLTMVDPDNRRPVDYSIRQQWLEDGLGNQQELWASRYTGEIKLWLTSKLLTQRTTATDIFANGIYLPIEVKGKYKDNIIAFARRHGNECYKVILPLHIASVAKQQSCTVTDVDWEDTRIVIFSDLPSEWTNTLTGANIKAENGIFVKDIFDVLPMAIMKTKTENSERSAGVLVPVFSLPSPFGIGDFGPQAYSFIDFLASSRQKYWQLLPLNPTEAGSGHSPYSSISSMASNTLFISPDMLVKDGLLTEEQLADMRIIATDKVDYTRAAMIRQELLHLAYEKYMGGGFVALEQEYENFCKHQAYWINDFAMYVVLRNQFGGQPWYTWTDEYKTRNASAMFQLAADRAHEINAVRWQQFITDKQWQAVRKYSNEKGVQLFGDMPFYMSHDSADVWANPEIFSLDADYNQTGIAGVPPDYFSETGQLWGMPTYKWNVLKENNYSWWMDRLKRNLEMFDVIRLDHFRAFETYWEVPAGETTAVKGNWLQGPGMDFFNAAEEQLGSVPFIAEDLGYEMEDVYALRDKTGLPGMKVLQFAFGKNIDTAVDAPHNFTENCVAYTGTHDNNTTVGWYDDEATPEDRLRINKYTNKKVTASNIADVLCQMAYSSTAKIAILPIQDIMGYGGETRINTPGTVTNNWQWRLNKDSLTDDVKKKLLKWTEDYDR